MNNVEFVAVGSVIIDDIVYPDGRTSMGVLGGGGTHSAYGIALSGETAGLIALVGHDLPEDIRTRLENDMDTSGLIVSEHEQIRGWQIFEWNGKRSEIFRVDVTEPFMFDPPADSDRIPYTMPKGLTLLREPKYVESWRKRFPNTILLWEPMRALMMTGDHASYVIGIPHVDIVSPNLLEAQTVYGVKDEVEIIRRMLADGVKVAVLRMGEKGSLVAQKDNPTAYYIPPVVVGEIVDQTGAGNTYCGGFIVGWCQTHNLVKAGCYGAVAASFTLETIGAAEIPDNLTDEHQQRMSTARTLVKEVAL